MHLVKDEKVIAQANNDMEGALNDVEGANDELAKKRKKLSASFNSLLKWFVLLFCTVTIVFYLTFI